MYVDFRHVWVPACSVSLNLPNSSTLTACGTVDGTEYRLIFSRSVLHMGWDGEFVPSRAALIACPDWRYKIRKSQRHRVNRLLPLTCADIWRPPSAAAGVRVDVENRVCRRQCCSRYSGHRVGDRRSRLGSAVKLRPSTDRDVHVSGGGGLWVGGGNVQRWRMSTEWVTESTRWRTQRLSAMADPFWWRDRCSSSYAACLSTDHFCPEHYRWRHMRMKRYKE